MNLSVGIPKPNYNITFNRDGREVGKLDFNGPEMVFTGDMAPSAQTFLEFLAQSFKGRLEQERAVAQSEWKEAVINELVVAHIYQTAHDTDPRKAIQDLITWHVQVALDPRVSSDAQALIDRGAAEERARGQK